MDVRLVTAVSRRDDDAELPVLERALAARGLSVAVSGWDDPAVDWSDCGLAWIRSTWNYHEQRDAFLAWAERVDRATALWNPPRALRVNSHKGYLLELARRGVATLPTECLSRGVEADLDGLLERRGWTEAVVKPAVSLGGIGARRVGRDDPDGADWLRTLLTRGDVLVQPFARSIEARGESSLVFIDGRLLHARRKHPAPGDFLVHEHRGGRTELATADADELAVAGAALAACDFPWLHARVDLVHLDGAPHLMELELIEPSLYLDANDAAALAAIGDAVERRLGASA